MTLISVALKVQLKYVESASRTNQKNALTVKSVLDESVLTDAFLALSTSTITVIALLAI